ncbi:unnamed protein product [Adineta steineri]|uniref:EF-hand domain-containing protein n=1 Tax=Adineta steineri TaxID=433720 RepID=A0A814W051_9BILA|nr:unnamed protein product [Adineta steineri]CAF1195359.1 unnamed protein product [Adineta steineri]CAF1201029.1 unnamed protein product [Adineta steineri]
MPSHIIDYSKQFSRADVNHDGIIDEKEFRLFLGPTSQDKNKSISNQYQYDLEAFSAAHVTQTITYEIGYDVAVAGFVKDPYSYEKYAFGISNGKDHTYGLGPDVGIGAPDIAKKIFQYDAAGAMFIYADTNRDGKIDQQEFGFFMDSV